MKSIFCLNKKQITYIFSMAFYYLWILCAFWLNHFWTIFTLGDKYVMFNYVCFLLFHGAGCFFFAWLSNRKKNISSAKVYRRIIIIISLFTVVLTASIAFSHGVWLSLVLFSLGFVSGFFVVFLQRFMYEEIPKDKIGVSMGYAFGISFAVNFILFVVLFPQQSGMMLYIKTFFTAALPIFTGIFTYLMYLDEGEAKAEGIARTGVQDDSDNKSIIKPSLIMLLFLISFLFYLIIGIQDYFATLTWLASGDIILYTRIFCIIGYIAAGILCDLKGRHMVILLSMSMIIAGLVPTLFSYTGIFAFICFSFIQLASAGFTLFIRIVFVDIANYSKNPILLASLGFVMPYFLKDPGILIGNILNPYGTTVVFAACVLLIAIMAPLITLLFVMVRDMHVGSLITVIPTNYYTAATEENASNTLSKFTETSKSTDSASLVNDSSADIDLSSIIDDMNEKYGLSERESQVLRLILLGQTPLEMSQTLYISESTVRFHIRNILKKTGTNTRVQLVSMVLTVNNNISQPE